MQLSSILFVALSLAGSALAAPQVTCSPAPKEWGNSTCDFVNPDACDGFCDFNCRGAKGDRSFSEPNGDCRCYCFGDGKPPGSADPSPAPAAQ